MRLTKRQLKRVIREEYSRLKRSGLIREMTEDEALEQYQKGWDAPDASPYTNLSDQASSALDALEACVQDCLNSGCKDADILDTIEAMLDPEGWESHDVDV